MNKPPIIARWILSVTNRKCNREIVLGDFEELFDEIRSGRGAMFAYLWFYAQAIKSIPNFISASTYWGGVMFKNYLKIAARNIKKYKGYSAINIFGLSVGLACCMLIILYVQFELSYDSYHPDADRIYRIPLISKASVGEEIEPANTMALAPFLKNNYPQVEEAARIEQGSWGFVKYKENLFEEFGVKYVDPEIFKIFSIPFIQGNPKNALNQPSTCVLTEDIAKKYFGTDNPVGKIIRIDTSDFHITGVIENAARNSHFFYSILVSLTSLENQPYMNNSYNNCITYVKLNKGENPDDFEFLIRDISNDLMKNDTNDESDVLRTNFLQPIKDIHLHSNLTWEMKTPGNLSYLMIFSLIGLFILLIACMNFINLTTAKSAGRAKEVGLRKVVGAMKNQLIKQFISESALITLFSAILAIGVVYIFLEDFNDLTNRNFIISDLFNLKFITGIIMLVIITGVIGGFYPALVLSRYSPVKIFRSGLTSGAKGSAFRKALIIFQFAVSLSLMIGTFIIYQQLNFMKNQNLGFDKEQKLVISIQRDPKLTENYEHIKNELKNHRSIINAAASSSIPGRGMNVWWTWPAGEMETKKHLINFLLTDYDFIDEYDLKLVAGRKFDKLLPTDTAKGVMIINEAAIDAFGWGKPLDAIGKEVEIWAGRSPVVGVMENIHWRGLQNAIEPLIVMFSPSGFRYITITISPSDLNSIIEHAKNVMTRWLPDKPFEYYFLDEQFNRQYQSEERTAKMFSIFTILGIVISSLGLFGLVSFIAQQKTKEIGIRKVLGASIPNILKLISSEFLILVITGNLIASPLTWWAMNKWLQNFAYRTDIKWSYFLLAALISIGITLFTISYQSFKAAIANPTDSLRSE